jgi:hypothetical protein
MSRVGVGAGLLAAAVLGALWWAAGLHRGATVPVPHAETSREVGTAALAASSTAGVAGVVRGVRTSLTRFGDSLRVVIAWEGPSHGVRLRLEPEGGRPVERRRASPGTADTVYLPTPAPGQSARGLACVDTRGAGSAAGPAAGDAERCTPWQFVRPSAAPKAGTGGDVRIVVRPDGMQVDPDVGGRCAAWRASHPAAPVWVAVNETAVPECTGPNGRPTIAQFCAFALLPDGRKLKTGGSSNDPYCEEEFERWLAERAS